MVLLEFNNHFNFLVFWVVSEDLSFSVVVVVFLFHVVSSCCDDFKERVRDKKKRKELTCELLPTGSVLNSELLLL